MKAMLEFTLPEELAEHELAVHAGDYSAVLDGVTQRVRGWRKHGHGFVYPDEALDAIWELIHQLRSEYGIVD